MAGGLAPFAAVGLAGLDDSGRRQHVYVHAKTMLVDHSWAIIGSANLHWFSLYGNAEMNVSFWRRLECDAHTVRATYGWVASSAMSSATIRSGAIDRRVVPVSELLALRRREHWLVRHIERRAAIFRDRLRHFVEGLRVFRSSLCVPKTRSGAWLAESVFGSEARDTGTGASG